jgi:StAR-related lipid transfer protein 3
MVHRQTQVTNHHLFQDEEFKQLGIETVIKAYELLESDAWKVEKVMANNDIIYATTKAIGKVYKLRAKVNHPAKKLLCELFYKIEELPSWNPTLLESRVIKVSLCRLRNTQKMMNHKFP